MAPSLVMWPTNMTGTPLSLAYFSSEAAHSRIWVMEPGDESTVSTDMVCMESITTRSGCTFLMCVKMCSSRVSHSSNTSLERSDMRSARNFI